MKKMLVLGAVLGIILISGCVSVHKECCDGVDAKIEQLEQRVSALEEAE